MLAELYFNLPLYSAILLLVAGVLIGYALWFPARGDAETITQRLKELNEKNDDLHSALKKNRDAYQQLENKYSDQCAELTALQQSSQRVESALHQQDAARADGVESLRELKESALKQLESERSERMSLEAQLRDTETSANETIHRKQQRIAKLEDALREARSIITQRETDRRSSTTLEMELADRREQCKTLSEALERSRADALEVTEELTAVKQQLMADSDAESHATSERLEQLATELKTRTEDYNNLQSKYSQLLEEFEAHRHQKGDLNQTRDSLVTAETMLTKALDAQDRAEMRVEELESELETMQSCMSELRETHQAVIDDREDVAEQLSMQQEQNLELQSEIKSQKEDAAELKRTSANTLAAQRSEFERELEQVRAQLQRATAEREDAIAANAESIRQREIASNAVTSLRQDLAHHQRAMATIERHRSKTQSSLSAREELHSDLEGKVAQQQHTIDALRDELAGGAKLRNQCISLQTALQDQTAQLKSVKLDRDEIAAELASVKGEAESISKRILSYEDDLDRVRQQRESLMEDLNAERDRNQELTQALAQQAERMELVGRHLTQLDPLKENVTQLTHQVQQQQQGMVAIQCQLESAEVDRDAAEETAKLAQQELATARDQLAEAQRSLLALERDRDEVLGRLRRQNVMLESHLARAESDSNDSVTTETRSLAGDRGSLQRELMRRDERRGLIYTSTPTEVDDLKLISGIAQVLEEKLNEFGIYRYRQIMEWDQVAIEEFSKLLSFRDRIERDNWIAQAETLFEEKYGRAA